MPRKTDKRVRLVEAAKLLIHQQGFNLTTLADIAQQADVPLGNVYYYFKTKEAIGDAVIDRRALEWKDKLAQLSQLGDPVTCILEFVDQCNDDLELIARFGCSVGGLCQELGKQGGTLANRAAKLLHDMLTWLESQWRALGFAPAHAQTCAYCVVGFIQGTHLLTHTFKDPAVAMRQTEWLRQWIHGIVADAERYKTSDKEAFIPAGLSTPKPVVAQHIVESEQVIEEEYA